MGHVRFTSAASRWEDSVNALLYRNEVDPFAEWLEARPGWDGVPVLANLLTTLFRRAR